MLYEIGDKVLDEWVITRTIGEGSYGKVVEIERNEFGLSMKSALKIISIPGNNSEIKAVMGEGVDNKKYYILFLWIRRRNYQKDCNYVRTQRAYQYCYL